MPQLWSMECWGRCDVPSGTACFLKETLWERLAALRVVLLNICLHMLLWGRNTVGYTPYPEVVTSVFVADATAIVVDIFRILDALNNVESMHQEIDPVHEKCSAIAKVAMFYTGDLSELGERLYTLDYCLNLAEQIVGAGAHVLAIKDTAGLLRTPGAQWLVVALRSCFGLSVHVYIHDTPGGQLVSYMAAWHADAVDGAALSLTGTTSLACVELDCGCCSSQRVRNRSVALRRVRIGAVLGSSTKSIRTLRIWSTLSDRTVVSP